MPDFYNGTLSPYAKPAKIETAPIVDFTGGLQTNFIFNNGDVLKVDISDNAGSTFFSSSFTFTTPNTFFTGADALVAYLNANFTGTPPFAFEWYVPSIESLSKEGVLNKKTFGNRIGVRTKTLLGDRSVIRIPSCTALFRQGINISPTFSRGESGFTELLNQPSPFDPFVALSVNLYQKGLRDRDLSLINNLKLNGEFANSMLVQSTDGASINVSNIPSTVQTNGKPIFISKPVNTVLTVANKGGSFAASTWYYAYNYYNIISNQITYEISSVAPTSDSLFKTGDQSRRYMFSFVTDGVASIRPFFRVGNNHTYFPNLPVLTNGNAIAATPVAFSPYMPPRASIAKLHSTYTVTSGVARQFKLWPSSFTGTATWIGICDTNNTQENSFLMPVFLGQVDYLIDNAGDNLSLAIEGFIE